MQLDEEGEGEEEEEEGEVCPPAGGDGASDGGASDGGAGAAPAAPERGMAWLLAEALTLTRTLKPEPKP